MTVAGALAFAPLLCLFVVLIVGTILNVCERPAIYWREVGKELLLCLVVCGALFALAHGLGLR